MPRYILFFFSLLSACSNSILIPENEFNSQDTLKSIENWLLIGPFPVESARLKDVTYMDFNYLSALGIEGEFTVLSRPSVLASAKKNHPSFFRFDSSSFPSIDLLDDHVRVPAVKYLAATIESTTDRNAVLLVNGVQSMKVWFNDTLIYTTTFKRNQSKFYEEYIPITLRRGQNRILIKLGVHDFSSKKTYWKLNASIASVDYAKHNFQKDYAFDFIGKACVDFEQNLGIYLGPYSKSRDIPFEIKDLNGKMILTGMFDYPDQDSTSGYAYLPLPDSLAGRVMSIGINLQKEWLKQDFYYGNITEKFQEIETAYKICVSGLLTKQDRINLHASFERLRYLMRVYTKGNDQVVRYWDRSRVAFLKELMTYFEQVAGNKGAVARFPGIIQGFVSSIDSSLQYYLFHLSDELKMKRCSVPLIIIMPFPTINDAPLLKSWFISNMDQILWDSRLADENGFAIMWVNLRGNPGINSIGIADFMECLQHAKTSYNIDTNRIFVLGNSAAASKALLYAARFPSVIAGCALVNPVLDISLKKEPRNPVGLMGNLMNSHIVIKAEIRDEVVPIASVKDFYQAYQSRLTNSVFIMSGKGSHFVAPKDNYRDVFSFFKNRSRIINPKEIEYSTFSGVFNESAWIKIDEKERHKKATISAKVQNDTVFVYTRHVKRMTLQIPFDEEGTALGVYVNDSKMHSRIRGKPMTIVVDSSGPNSEISGGKRVEEIFGAPFLLVNGAGAEKMAKSFNDLWMRKFFVKSPRKRDKNVSLDDIRKYNLVMVGNEHDNVLIRQLSRKVPLKFTEDSIVIANKVFHGKSLLCYVSIPHALDKERDALVIGTKEFNGKLPLKDIANEGKFEYMLFQGRDSTYSLIEAGFLN